MIIAEQKEISEIIEMIGDQNKVLVIGCNTCVTVCLSGGAKEAAILASALRLAFRVRGKQVEIDETSIERQCEPEFVDALSSAIKDKELLVSMGCGIGVQTIAERFDHLPVVPALNTNFLGLPAHFQYAQS